MWWVLFFGGIAYYEEFSLESDDIPAQSIFKEWGFDFSDLTFGLEACSRP